MRHLYAWFLLALILIPILLVQIPVSAQGTEEEYLQITVKQGDTLWNIAETHKPKGQDIRKFMYQIERLNELETLVLQPGQVLLIPK